ncbi:phosphate ABC transporter permease subunit PstC [Micromonospora echinaurantiaca]|uniref:phosphate ABC transporter permease subunit PstC n=1 Tax=Micromonospora TaxID=1873 RepID=UPI000D6F3723|nr:phosphate ABC transporter permease subunit PstC [Micromonospora sp. S4605]PWU50390.1 phosphate ABC transporter permease subunit PstC [Micromonospora sp. S4605]
MTTSTPSVGSAAGSTLRRGRRRPVDSIVKVLLVAAALVSIATTVGIVIALVGPTIEFFQQVSIVEFFTGTSWTPTFAQKAYGVLPLVGATMVVTVIALLIAVPIGLGSAIYLSEYAKPATRKLLKPMIELLAGVPTVVYGFVALFALNPLLQQIWPGDTKPGFQNLLIAGIAMGIMIVPTIASISEDSMASVPRSLREGAYALASTKMQVSTRVVVPAAISGIVAAIVLGISRAVGETMIVTIAGGLVSDKVTVNPLEGAATMTAFIANISSGDIPVGSLDYDSVFAVGALLFLITFVLNAVSIRMVRRFREVYE